MYQRILVPVDGSPTSNRGLDEAVKLALLCGARLRLLHVVDELSLMMGLEAYAALSADTTRLLREGGAEILAQAQARALSQGAPAARVDTRLVDSFAVTVCDQVLAEVATWAADAIVLGTHGRRGVQRLLMGSDAERIVRLASVPVLLVRSAEVADRTPPRAGGAR